MRRLAVTLVALVVAAAGVVGLLAFLQGRDEAAIGPQPGRPAPTLTGADLARGDVRLVATRRADRAALEALAAEFADPTGEEPTVRVAPGDGAGSGVRALAYRRRLDATSPDDPRLRAFIEFWLGRGRM